MSNVDRFYPMLDNINSMSSDQLLALVSSLLSAYRRAEGGDADGESSLCNLVGSIRRSANSMKDLPTVIQDTLWVSVEYLKTTGRKVTLNQVAPEMWISQRNGKPRWVTLHQFKVPTQRPRLLGNSELDERPDVVAFIERFGSHWVKGTLPDSWFLLADGDQFVWRNNEYAHYMFETKEEFLERYGSGLDAFYFDRDATRWKYPVLQLMHHLKEVHS